MRSFLIAATILMGCSLVGCSSDETGSDPPSKWIDDVEAELPSALSDVGLAGVDYTPPHALYSNGLDKRRSIYLPEGATITATQGAGWDFPVGTVLSKAFDHEGAPVETRLIFRRADGWEYALYEWAGDDAMLFEGNWSEKVVELSGDVTHTLPARLDCRTCHETYEGSVRHAGPRRERLPTF